MIQLPKSQISTAAHALADGFRNDPLWNKLFEDDGPEQRRKRFEAFFEFPVRHCMRYGLVEAYSPKLEGIACWAGGDRADQTFWSVLRCGLFGAALRLGPMARRLPEIFDPVSLDRRTAMAGRKFAYLYAIGVREQFQGQGIGRTLLTSGLDRYDKQNIPVYLETETEGNVQMYEHFGFRVLKKVTLDQLNLPIWEMVREPFGATP